MTIFRKVKFTDYFIDLFLLPFVFPLGWQQYSAGYKKVILLLTLLSLALGLAMFLFLGKLYLRWEILWIGLSCIELLIVTLYQLGTITDGFKKIFVVPLLTLILFNLIYQYPQKTLNALGNLIAVTQLLNITVFNQKLFSQFSVTSLITFLGHVQSIAMVGTLGILIGYLKIQSDHKESGWFLIVVSTLDMLYSQTDASRVVLAFLILGLLVRKNQTIRDAISNHIIFLFMVILLINILIISANGNTTFGAFIQNNSSGRSFVWQIGIADFLSKPLIGYGAYGIKMAPFWVKWSTDPSVSQGFNYAHNTLLQLLLDGGLILAIFGLLFFLTSIKNVKKIESPSLRYFVCLIILSWLIIASVESVVEYYYVFLALPIIACVYRYYDNPVASDSEADLMEQQS